MPKNRGHIASLARSYTDTAIKTLAGIMMEQTSPPMARIVAAKVLLDRGWGMYVVRAFRTVGLAI